ncbi:MAG: enolase C-terminal domain-like protein, partial [Alphaproteobacteria bacterium]
AGMVMSVQDTTGSEISFAAILHMAQSTPRHLLRCALDPRSMVSTRIAEFDAPVINGGATAPDLPGLGVTPNQNAIGAPVAIYEGA